MLIGEIISVALGALRANKLRSLLTMLGIVIGVTAVIAMIALGNGAQQQVNDRIRALGTTLLTVQPGQQRTGGGFASEADRAPLTMKDAVALVQSTLFEGGPGGGAVYDAVSLGAPSLVSDIAVNREIDEPTVRFFRVRDPDDLAAAMERCLAGDVPARSTPEDLLVQGRIRRTACGRVLMQAAAMSRCP